MPCYGILRKQNQGIVEMCKGSFVEDNCRSRQKRSMVPILCESPTHNNRRREIFGNNTRRQMSFNPIYKRARKASLSMLRGTSMGNNLEQAATRHVVSRLRKQESWGTASSHN